MKKLIILDRDGVINYDSDSYIKTPDEWHAIPGSLEAIARLNRAGFYVVVATNQSGVARGYFDVSGLDLIHEKMFSELASVGGHIEEIFFCPHHPEENCSCRKPKPGLLQKIHKKYDVDLKDVFFIGDKLSDIEAAKTAGCKPILILTSLKIHDLELNDVPYFLNLAEAVEYVIKTWKNTK
ncbi:MAG TPA: D-glycero-beta-D-manno-heptose 1,7-bisphosphate 7-phosphatase [Gammaproteobacteria bacterium]|nr:D-glycero-beta-D-manno-heptose 1,7-bisphosphate 7-phosphatase [Gammaproteobacteria bacterium]